MNQIKLTLQKNGILIAISALTLLGAMAQAGGLPGIGKIVTEDLHLNATQLGGLLAINHLGIMLFSGWAGYQSDHRPVLQLFILGLLLQFASIIGFAVSTNYGLLLFFRMLDGIGFSFVNVAGTSEILRRYPLSQRAIALGVKGTIFPASIMLGSIIVPYLSFLFNWRIALLIASLGPILALLLATLVFPLKAPVVALARKPSMSPLKAMKIPVVWWLGMLGTICMLVQNGVISFLPLYFQNKIELSFATSLQYLTFIILSGIGGRVLIGYLSSKIFGVKLWLLFIMLATSICLIILSQLNAVTEMWFMMPLLLLLGIALFGWYGSYVALMNELSPKGSTGAFAGVATQFTALGAIFGPGLLGIFIDSLGYSIAFLLLALLLLGMGAVTFLLPFNRISYATRDLVSS